MKIGFLLFADYHQKKDIGSSRIRGEYVIKYLEGAEKFKQGEKYDVVVFQKCYWKEYARQFKGLKILDICDPDYHEGSEVVNFIQDIDIITVPTKALQKDIQQFTDKPVHLIPDRMDPEDLPKPKLPTKGDAKKVVWFGYSGNMGPVEDAMVKIKQEGLKLILITDCSYNTSICEIQHVKWKYPKAYTDIQEADFAVFPEYIDRMSYKSNNKDVLSKALGLPVAKTPNDFDRLIKYEERLKDHEEGLREVKEKYDSRLSAKQFSAIMENKMTIMSNKT